MDTKAILKNRRLELNMTIEEVARLVGVSGATVSRWETGDIENMRRDKIGLLAAALQVSPSYLMGWTDTPNENTIHANLSTQEKQLLSKYNALNQLGQTKTDEYIADLVENPRYQKTNVIANKIEQDNIVSIEVESTTKDFYTPTVAAAHHPTGVLSDADRKDIQKMNEIVGKLKRKNKEQKNQ